MKNFKNILYVVDIFLAILFILIMILFSDVLLGGIQSIIAIICGLVSIIISTIILSKIIVPKTETNQIEINNISIIILMVYTIINLFINLLFGIILNNNLFYNIIFRYASILIILNVLNTMIMIIIELFIFKYYTNVAIKTEKLKNLNRSN